MRRSASIGGVNMTPMIDVVFQMIIFFVCTAKLEQEAISEFIHLADSPHGPKVAEERDPRTITVEVDEKGRFYIARTHLTPARLRKVLRKTVQEYGPAGPDIPVVIRADARSLHSQVRKALDACTEAGLSRISFMAVKERA
jgi:biopolymer transport protein ExbD